MKRLWWLSFCDPELPKGSQFLGAVVIDGQTFDEALINSHLSKANPGGEVMFHEIPPTLVPEIHESWCGVVMDRATCEKFDNGGWKRPCA